jgi:hypothetical protein
MEIAQTRWCAQVKEKSTNTLVCTSYREKHKHAGMPKLRRKAQTRWCAQVMEKNENTLLCTSYGEK